MITVLIALFAGAALYETTTMVDADSYVFPRMVTITLIVLACIQIVTEARSRKDTAPTRVAPNHSSSFRRVGFVMALLTTVALIPVFGFLIAGSVDIANFSTFFYLKPNRLIGTVVNSTVSQSQSSVRLW